jgi:hypothetical protein
MPDDGRAIAALSNLDMRPDMRPDTNRDETTNSPALSEEFADTKADMTGSSAAPDNRKPVVAEGRQQVLAAFV